MLLRAIAIGEDPCRRFIVMKLEDRTLWNGTTFTNEFDEAQMFFHPSDACLEMQAILKEHYKHLPERHFVVPIEITVHGDVSDEEVAEYLFQASVLSLRTEEFDNGPNGSLVLPIIHWGCLKPTDGPVNLNTDDPVADWGLGQDDDFGDE